MSKSSEFVGSDPSYDVLSNDAHLKNIQQKEIIFSSLYRMGRLCCVRLLKAFRSLRHWVIQDQKFFGAPSEFREKLDQNIGKLKFLLFTPIFCIEQEILIWNFISFHFHFFLISMGWVKPKQNQTHSKFADDSTNWMVFSSSAKSCWTINFSESLCGCRKNKRGSYLVDF